jgi:hypothetical protein
MVSGWPRGKGVRATREEEKPDELPSCCVAHRIGVDRGAGRARLERADSDLLPGRVHGARFFATDFIVRMSVRNTVRGLHHFVVGTWTVLYGS